MPTHQLLSDFPETLPLLWAKKNHCQVVLASLNEASEGSARGAENPASATPLISPALLPIVGGASEKHSLCSSAVIDQPEVVVEERGSVHGV